MIIKDLYSIHYQYILLYNHNVNYDLIQTGNSLSKAKPKMFVCMVSLLKQDFLFKMKCTAKN